MNKTKYLSHLFLLLKQKLVGDPLPLVLPQIGHVGNVMTGMTFCLLVCQLSSVVKFPFCVVKICSIKRTVVQHMLKAS